MNNRLVLGFALLMCIAIVLPGTVFGRDVERAPAQATTNTPTVLAVVRNQGASLHDQPDGVATQNLVGGSLVTAQLLSQDRQWVLVFTRDDTQGWLQVNTLLAAGLSRLPIQSPTATPTLSPTPTSEQLPTPSDLATATATVTAGSVPQEETTPVAAATDTSQASVTPQATVMTQATVTPQATVTSQAPVTSQATVAPAATVRTAAITPGPTTEPTPEATLAVATPVPTPTPFVTPTGPTVLTLVRIGGANLWRSEDGAFVAHFTAGKRLTGAYRTADNGWYFVYDDTGLHGWVMAGQILVVNGESLSIQAFTIPGTDTSSVSDVEEDTEVDAVSETPTPTPVPTATVQRVVITVQDFGQRLNVRAGPGTGYDIVAKAVAGVAFNGIGRNEAGSWVQVTIADLPSGYGWVSANYVDADGSLELLPVVE